MSLVMAKEGKKGRTVHCNDPNQPSAIQKSLDINKKLNTPYQVVKMSYKASQLVLDPTGSPDRLKCLWANEERIFLFEVVGHHYLT